MFVKKLELSGFKSFGGRVIVSAGPHIMGVVGPNGSGKSNIADAVRWVLGEQSNKLLRLNKSEEIIFAGTDKRPKASMAEVILTLDNSDGAMDVDWVEVEITRRLYRSGDSDYLLNGKRTRLLDIQELLAKSGFGQNSYSVIGQGMIDRLIISTPAERKLLFDDASGIRQYELKRESNVKKLHQAQENMLELERLLAQLRPEYRVVQAEAERISARDQLEQNLRAARLAYLNSNFSSLSEQTKQVNHGLITKQQQLDNVVLQIDTASRKKASQQQARHKQYQMQQQLLSEIRSLTTERTTLADELAQHKAQSDLRAATKQTSLSYKSELKNIDQELGSGEKTLEQLNARLSKVRGVIAKFEDAIVVINTELKTHNSTLGDYRREIGRGQKREYLHHAIGLLNMLVRDDKISAMDKKDRDLALHKLRRMLQLAAEDRSDTLTGEVAKLQNKITRLMGKREDLVEQQNREIIRERSIELDIGFLEDHQASLKNERSTITQTHDDSSETDISKERKVIAGLQAKVRAIDSAITRHQKELAAGEVEDGGELTRAEAEHDELIDQKSILGREVERLTQALVVLQSQTSQLHEREAAWFGGIEPPAEELVLNKKLVKISLEQILELEAELKLSSDFDSTSQVKAKQLISQITELEQQQADLEQARQDIEKVLANLDKQIRETFAKSFQRINKYFNLYAVKLFGGGHAELLLSIDETGVYGIEIAASPRGKRPTQVSSLSGGERALTGIALLAAIMAVNPSPFVILDEVDAALDEANSLKFADILTRIAKHTQLIVITHNHETMKVADQLVGITSGADGSAMAISASLVEHT